MNWNRNTISCLDTVVREIQNSEQTQEIKVPDGMPDVGKVLCAWGQPILRSKEWSGGRITLGAGMMVWVLYQGEDGGQPKCLDAWVPFQLRFDLPEDAMEGELRIRCLPRFVDARSVSPRKLLVRCSLGCLAEAFSPQTVEIYEPEGVNQGVELLESTYPMRLWREAGEKTISFDEELTVPDSFPEPEAVVYYRLSPTISEKKVMSDKILFRGNGNLHLLYRGPGGELQGWDVELPFSQYAQLDTEHSSDAQGDVALCVTDMELNIDQEGHLRFQAAVTGQYAITDKVLLRLAEDAYCPGHSLEMQTGEVALPVILEQRRETVQAQQSVPQEVRSAVDAAFLPDFPRQRRNEDTLELTLPGTFLLLFYDGDGGLQGTTVRWEGNKSMPASEESRMMVHPLPADVRIQMGPQVELRTELPLELTATADQRIPMLTGVNIGPAVESDPDRPSLIVRRAGGRRLWDIAKESGSTMEAIRRANGFQEEPEPGRMLLIPVP